MPAKKSARKTAKKGGRKAAKRVARKPARRGARKAAKKVTRKSAVKKGERKYGKKASKKVGRVMHEFKQGELKSGKDGAGSKVMSRGQAIAIGISEAREEGDKVPAKRGRKASP